MVARGPWETVCEELRVPGAAMFGVALLFVSGAALAGATLIEFVAVGERRYLCRDPQRWVGDCEDGRYRTVSEGFGYRTDEGLRVGRGYFILPTPYDAELVCDFSREGDVSGDVTVRGQKLFVYHCIALSIPKANF